MFNKTARRTGKCGECKYFNADKNVCMHPEMNKAAVSALDISKCGGNHYLPLDDYENH